MVGGFSRIGPLVRGRLEEWEDPPSLARARVPRDRRQRGPRPGGEYGPRAPRRVAAPARARCRAAARMPAGRSSPRRATRTCAASSWTSRCAARCAPAPSACWRPASPCTCSCTTRASCPQSGRRRPEGLELTFATNVLGPHLLTRLLRERLIASAPARVIFVSSGGMYTRRLDVDDLQSREGDVRRPRRLCAQQARARSCSRSAGPRSSRARASSSTRCTRAGPTRPASRPRSRRSGACMRPLLRSPEQGADTIVWLAAAPEPGSDDRPLLERPPRAPHASSARAHARDRRGARTALACARRARGRSRRADMITLGND